MPRQRSSASSRSAPRRLATPPLSSSALIRPSKIYRTYFYLQDMNFLISMTSEQSPALQKAYTSTTPGHRMGEDILMDGVRIAG